MAAATAAQQAFCDCDKYALFDASGQVIASSYQVQEKLTVLATTSFGVHSVAQPVYKLSAVSGVPAQPVRAAGACKAAG